MKHDTEKHYRRSVRLKEYDYSAKGSYFVTICTKEKKYLLGDVVNGEMILSGIGEIVKQCWIGISNHFSHVQLDKYVILPNHVHGIIVIVGDVGVENIEPYKRVGNIQPLRKINRYQKIIPGSLGSIVRGFKIGVSKCCNQHNYSSFAWQRNYYEHIVRNEDALNLIRGYIVNNPLQWQFDRENPNHIQDESYDNQWKYLIETVTN
ncbi:MAG TPA: transposase [Candidatus Hypogeohydataceae bacterium YC41]